MCSHQFFNYLLQVHLCSFAASVLWTFLPGLTRPHAAVSHWLQHEQIQGSSQFCQVSLKPDKTTKLSCKKYRSRTHNLWKKKIKLRAESVQTRSCSDSCSCSCSCNFCLTSNTLESFTPAFSHLLWSCCMENNDWKQMYLQPNKTNLFTTQSSSGNPSTSNSIAQVQMTAYLTLDLNFKVLQIK